MALRQGYACTRREEGGSLSKFKSRHNDWPFMVPQVPLYRPMYSIMWRLHAHT